MIIHQSFAPNDLALSTNWRSRILSTWARTNRTNAGKVTTERISQTIWKLWPHTAARPNASNIAGKASRISITRMIIQSILPE